MPVTAEPSLRYELILDGAVRRYPSGREVCCDTVKGKREYNRRVEAMALRQHGVCCLGHHLLKNPTFEHSIGRGLGAGHRDDRITDEDGRPMNGAACWTCNGEKGSRRL
jgi:hypothetical protein